MSGSKQAKPQGDEDPMPLAQASEPGSGRLRILQVDSAMVLPLDMDEQMIVVVAKGRLDTSPWSCIALDPITPQNVPADGVMELDFTGIMPPRFNHLHMPVTACIAVPRPTWLKGVRVRAKTNAIVAMMPAGS